ncbi:hypothetical protein [Actinomadura sp. 3N508]|uniref:hypothetical protein n=1 Tax=Actinomadura sp. 3N508 TaxID=3375153 RepID=UPI0037A943A0
MAAGTAAGIVRNAPGKLAVMWTGEQGSGGVRRRTGTSAVPPVQSFLFGHSRAEVVYDCR